MGKPILFFSVAIPSAAQCNLPAEDEGTFPIWRDGFAGKIWVENLDENTPENRPFIIISFALNQEGTRNVCSSVIDEVNPTVYFYEI